MNTEFFHQIDDLKKNANKLCQASTYKNYLELRAEQQKIEESCRLAHKEKGSGVHKPLNELTVPVSSQEEEAEKIAKTFESLNRDLSYFIEKYNSLGPDAKFPQVDGLLVTIVLTYEGLIKQIKEARDKFPDKALQISEKLLQVYIGSDKVQEPYLKWLGIYSDRLKKELENKDLPVDLKGELQKRLDETTNKITETKKIVEGLKKELGFPQQSSDKPASAGLPKMNPTLMATQPPPPTSTSTTSKGELVAGTQIIADEPSRKPVVQMPLYTTRGIYSILQQEQNSIA